MTLSRPASSVFWFVWHSLATIAIVLIASQLSVILKLEADIGKFSVGMAATYCASVIVLTFYTPKEGKIRLIELSSIFLSIFGSFFLILLLTNSVYSRWVLIISLVVISAFTVLSLSLKTTLQKPALYMASTLIVLIFLAGLADRMRPEQPAVLVVKNKLIRTNFYNLIARYHHNFVLEEATGGAISKFGDRYLLATGDGQLHVLSWDPEKKKLESRKLALQVPLNRDEFVRDAAQHTKKVGTGSFRTADILVQDFGDDFRLFASHHHWNSEKQCFTVRVSAISGRYSDFVASEESQTWQTVYESDPCLGFKNKADPFAGYQVGGKLVLLDNHRLLLAIGDHQFDGVLASKILSQDKTGSYGKTILINLDTHAASIYSMGHRNPEGLDVDPSGTIWLAEHGPKGGDELNIILKDKNYGWPLVTYGTAYTQPIWPLNAKQGRHEGFERPVYAWIPSIGISAVVKLKGSLFKIWKDDLLVSSLADQSIWRVRVVKGRTIFAERIEIGERIRDILEDANGRLILWTEASFEAPTQTTIVIVEPPEDNYKAMEGLNSVERGELLFARCDGCHKLEDGTVHGIGPDLKGIFQRRIAAAKGYNYSEALKGFSGRWTEENLDAFLTNPRRFIPGTSMQVEGVPDPTERGSLIEYLKGRK
jgi:cytochrome c2